MQTKKKLSVIIPVYNWDVSLLIEALAREVISEQLSGEIEILVADDCSQPQYKDKNRSSMSAYSFCRYYELDEQLGRAGVKGFIESTGNI